MLVLSDSCAYIVLETSVGEKLKGVGIAFTIGRGNETVCAAAKVLRRFVVGLTLQKIITDFAAIWRSLTNDGQLCWIGMCLIAANLSTIVSFGY
eukprot:SAG31_NODE_3282_length_4467_cov_2.622024_1_plen_94_part_00